jgi:hypothetical protein
VYLKNRDHRGSLSADPIVNNWFNCLKAGPTYPIMFVMTTVGNCWLGFNQQSLTQTHLQYMVYWSKTPEITNIIGYIGPAIRQLNQLFTIGVAFHQWVAFLYGLCPSPDIPHYHLRIFPEFPAFPLSQQYITMIINMIYVYWRPFYGGAVCQCHDNSGKLLTWR